MPKSPKKHKGSFRNRVARLLLLFVFFAVAIVFVSILVSCSQKQEDTVVSRGLAAQIQVPSPSSLDIFLEEDEEVEIQLTGEALYNSYVHEICETYYPNVDPYLIRSMIQQESSYRPDIIGDSGRSYGLMQIQPRWNQDRMAKLGVTDLLDPYSNILVGIDLVSELLESSPTIEYALMSYNGGPDYARRLYSKGQVSSYAREVLARFETLKGGA